MKNGWKLISGAVLLGLFLTVSGILSKKPGKDAVAQAEASYVGADTCINCHEEQAGHFKKTKMGKLFTVAPKTETQKLGCEACHGPGSLHVEDPADESRRLLFSKVSTAPVKQQNAACLQCHEKDTHVFWKGSPHESRGVACVNCHTIMKPVEGKKQLKNEKIPKVCAQCHPIKLSQIKKNAHMPLKEGSLVCSDCHNPHGTVTPKMLRANSVTELCYQCHAEKRGPFLWEHPPVRENCLNCHDPHGSNNDKLLVMKRERLCQQCHDENRHPTTPHPGTGRFVFNRSCNNCHTLIHGSNHPSGMFFQR